MGLAVLASSRATCSRRAVGCVLTNGLNHVIATGYNGVPRGMAHCGVEICPGLKAESGQSLDGCMATHAEQNALLQCRNVDEIHTAYVTAQPCITCMKLLMNTSCERIVYLTSYPHPLAVKMWTNAGKEIFKLSLEEIIQVKDMFQVASERSERALK